MAILESRHKGECASYNRPMPQTFDVCIRGAGVVGHTLALLLARERLRVALVSSAPPCGPDVRAYALNTASRQLLESLRTWPDAVHASPVLRMQVQGDQGGEVLFDAASQGAEALTWIVDVPALETRLAEAVRYQPQVERVSAPVPAALTVICEGRASQTRTELGVDFEVTPYAQHAIATRLVCELPHGQTARQWFHQGSILALLPLDGEGGHKVAVVWSVPAEQVAELLALDDDSFTQALEAASYGELGALQLCAARAAWPLQQAQASRWCGPVLHHGQPSTESWVLAGDAAHNVHPLAGQGLNLGLGDVQALAQILSQREEWRSVADLRLLRRYERERKAAILPVGLLMDGLQQLFSRPEPPLQALRNWGMNSFERSGLLKDWMARRAMGTR
ncbi:Ubiquinone biosynthesis hydroxylase, UbiH/UbiF/VisC/COQ6 family [Giesbergeria anulus]|uniref:Ubiquinone biosynthesis hydroxylase, UbiH/UbiF/VisC/COQ6 family n=2 Tax=Giesbergeria anulus TaxID=180197 RepID=A0A1H9QSC2_9BURK|nr:Ubiquinone biosynthesis hydroxylase, UbiH/UbiF/VisC/COQ6 family [Giesbergeria anulus]